MKKRILPLKTLLRACPVCLNTSEGFVLHTQSFILPEGHLLAEAKQYDIVSCCACGFVYADTPVKQKTYDKYYADMSKYEMRYSVIESARYASQAKTISTIVRDKNVSVMDVGAGNGGLLLAMKKLGYKNLTALDPSEKCVKNMLKNGIKAQTGSVFRHKVREKFDLVILSHVMEHLVDVDKALSALIAMTADKGVLYVEVPDAAMYAENHVVPFYFFDTEHINHFEEVSLINLGFRHGLRAFHLGRNQIQVSETTKYPVIHIAYKRDGAVTDWRKASGNKILKYIALSNKGSASQLVIDDLIKKNKEILIWGAGNFTMRMLNNSNLSKCDIIGFVDKDPKKHGTKILHKRVYPADHVKKISPETIIVVCAAVFSEQILKELKAMKVKNEVVVLK
ncbi:MAG: methyltransferase domain-containing protein [Smithella sp.]|nr:methyltransferase domain-containing protein [Smithella sp.]